MAHRWCVPSFVRIRQKLKEWFEKKIAKNFKIKRSKICSTVICTLACKSYVPSFKNCRSTVVVWKKICRHTDIQTDISHRYYKLRWLQATAELKIAYTRCAKSSHCDLLVIMHQWFQIKLADFLRSYFLVHPVYRKIGKWRRLIGCKQARKRFHMKKDIPLHHLKLFLTSTWPHQRCDVGPEEGEY